MSKSICDLVGSTITHKKYGECQVIEITDKESFKFSAKIISSGEIKQFIFSTQFFSVKGDYESAKIVPVAKLQKERKYKPVDYEKYRNHPLVKEIDKKESKKPISLYSSSLTDDDDDDTDSDVI